MALYDEAIQKGYNIGESLYTQSLFFTSPLKLIDSKIQSLIKKFSFCKNFNCPPYPSLEETPAQLIDDFMVIQEEINNVMAKEQKNVK